MSSPLCPSGEAVGEVFGSIGGPQGLSRVEELLQAILDELRDMHRIQDEIGRQQNEFRLKYEATFIKPNMPLTGPEAVQQKTEMLMGMCGERDAIESQIEAVEEQARLLDDQDNPEIAKVVRLQLQSSGLPQRLEFLKDRISSLQRSIEAESLNPANETAAAEPGEPEAK